jgi:hypothetical protein
MNTPGFMLKISDIVLDGTISCHCFRYECQEKIFLTDIDYRGGLIEITAYSKYDHEKSQKWILQSNLPQQTADYLKTYFNVIDMNDFLDQLEQ